MGQWLNWVRYLLVVWSLACSMGAMAAERVLRVGVYNNPPKIFFEDGGNATGVFIALLKDIAQVEGWELRFQSCEWEECLRRLEQGELDIMPDVARTSEREARFDFHAVAALSSWSQLYRRPGTKIESVVDLRGKRVAVLASGVQRDSLRALLEGMGVQAEFVATPTVAAAFSMVQQGQADVAASSYHFGDYSAPAYGLVGSPVLFNPAKLYFAAGKDRQADVLAAIDARLQQWQADAGSPYYEVLREWSGVHAESPIPEWVVHSFIAAAGGALALVLVSMWLRRRVREAVAQVQAQRDEMEATLRAVPDLLFEMDGEGRYLQVHANQPDLLVAQREALLGKRVADVMPPEQSALVLHCIQEAIAQGHSTGQRISLGLPDGVHWFELSAARKAPASGRKATAMVLSRDVTERVQDQAEIARLADFDHLTSLPNRAQLRRLFDKAAARAHRHGQAMAVVFLDIDHFKNINDSLGHALGDKMLMEVARRLQQSLRDTDIACRMGGDEFVMVLDDIDGDGAVRMAQRLQHALHAPFDLGPFQSGVTASIGIAMFPDDATDLDTLLRNADTAMYQAKQEGRNGVRFFTQAMQVRSERLLELSSALDKAVERGELTVMYQPLARLDSGRVAGAEALLRWTHPILGMVSPVEFIPVAESAGQILVIGEWVLRQACQQARNWDFAGRNWVMAVNVSFIQFRQTDFVLMVERVLHETGLPGHCLELELTESVAMGDTRKAEHTMRQLRAMDVRVAIDDFGTGYSSMSYLRRLGFHKLKIDQSFVRHIGEDVADESIITATIQLARSLGMQTLAEGVETETQRRFLRAQGCDLMQGWLLSKAIPPSEWEPWLHAPGSAVVSTD
ncbi:EAL domain-containing protein [Curvibacter sp. APW13]|uniref:EAL domain-containing protein n=1 Tax=Curvibacter sp. APW13 TaxID=3077236 RepID=UPI0028DECD91|nr:EAL domain-containing protein [Curvibacter sp. APW13]MDT8991270.1 EAL domain-containing protein [Curvibacter sp. APW13]